MLSSLDAVQQRLQEVDGLRLTHFYQLPGNPQATKLMMTKTLFPWINMMIDRETAKS